MQDSEENAIIYGSRVALQVCDGSFVQADRNSPHLLSAGRPTIRFWELFTVVPAEKNWDAWGWWLCYGNKIGLRASNGSYVQSDFSSNWQGMGELHAYDYTKAIAEWETFVVIKGDPSEDVRQQCMGRPVKLGDSFLLQACGNRIVSLAKENLHLVASKKSFEDRNLLRFIAPDAEALNQLRQDAQKVRKELSRSRAELKRQEDDVRQREERVKEVEQQELAIQREQASLQRWAQALKEQQEEVKQLQALQEECAKNLLERDERKLREFKKRGGLMEKAIEQFQERQELLHAAFLEIDSLRQCRAELEKKLSNSPDIEVLREQIGELKDVIQKQEEQTALLQQKKQEYKELESRRGHLEENMERLLALVEHLPQLRQQVEVLERRLTVYGQEAEGLEHLIQSLTPELVRLQDVALQSLLTEVRTGLETSARQEEQLRKTERELRELEVRYERAKALYDERWQVLELYFEADRRVAEGLAIHGANATSGSLSTIETLVANADDLLNLLDRALRAAIEANAAAGRLEHLDFTSK